MEQHGQCWSSSCSYEDFVLVLLLVASQSQIHKITKPRNIVFWKGYYKLTNMSVFISKNEMFRRKDHPHSYTSATVWVWISYLIPLRREEGVDGGRRELVYQINPPSTHIWHSSNWIVSYYFVLSLKRSGRGGLWKKRGFISKLVICFCNNLMYSS